LDYLTSWPLQFVDQVHAHEPEVFSTCRYWLACIKRTWELRSGCEPRGGLERGKTGKGDIMSNEVVYISDVQIERVKGPLRRAYLPPERKPVLFGVHSEVAEYYGVDPAVHEPQATTLDYVVAATAG
jgi:hypothetical protein